MDQEKFNSLIGSLKIKYGISSWGVVGGDLTPLSFKKFEDWVLQGHAGPLHYLCDERKEKRKSPTSFFPSALQSLVFAFDYRQSKVGLEKKYKNLGWNKLKMASYLVAYPVDYHSYLSQGLTEIGEILKEKFPSLQYHKAIDVLPLLERDFAYQAGLGWFGKNSMLINREFGSYFLIGSLFLDQTIFPHQVNFETDHCGTCLKCVDACPTNAINGDTRTLIAEKCISTFTIETFKETSSPVGMEKSNGEFFGCDICQEVCPWNQKPLFKIKDVEIEHELISFFLMRPIAEIIGQLNTISLSYFKRLFSESSMGRTGKKGILKNLKFWHNKI